MEFNVHASTGGAVEEGPVKPVGEYAMSRLGGERVFTYFAEKYGAREQLKPCSSALAPQS